MTPHIKHCALLPCLALSVALCACTSYDETPETIEVRVRLVYPENSPVGPYPGARVELTNASASTFVDSTDAQGVATFRVPGGLYDASSSSTYVADGYRYIFNGRQDKRVVSPDSADNDIDIQLTMSRRRHWD